MRYKQILKVLNVEIDALPPGTRLPSVRTLMRRFQVSQSAIDRCFDELAWQGMIRRDPGKGIFVDGYTPKNRMLGVCGNRLDPDSANTAFFKGFMAAARASDFIAVDFGPTDGDDLHHRILPQVETGGFAGLAINISGIAAGEIAGDAALIRSLSESKIPKVLTQPLPAVWADSVGGNDYAAYRQIGRQLADPRWPVVFLGRPDPRVLVRWQGLLAGLGPAGSDLHSVFDPDEWKNSGGGENSLPANAHWVMGCENPVLAGWLLQNEPRPTPAQTVLLVGDDDPISHSDSPPFIWTRSSIALGARTAELLIRRIHRPRNPLLHEIVPLLPPPSAAP